MFCTECGAAGATGKYCASCGTSLSVANDHRCISCDVPVEAHVQICGSCDSASNSPRQCPNCKKKIKNNRTKKGVISAIAGRVRSCKECGFNFFIPPQLAKVLIQKNPTPFSQIDVEWLFFAAFAYQVNAFGCEVPAIDCDDEGNWEDLYWPNSHQVFSNGLELLEKYQQSPQLWYANEIDEMTIEFMSALHLDQLDDDSTREALCVSLDKTSSADHELVMIVKSLLSEESVLNTSL